ncbi:MAG: hypothetical protein ACJ75T_01900 [Solirubrobacterales bacterium]
MRLSPAQVKAAAEKRLTEAQAATRSGRYPGAPEGRHYGKTEGDDRVHQFFSVDGDLTFGRAHVHVVHDERNDEVRLHVSFGDTNRHSEKIALVGALGNDVNAAVDLLTAELRTRMG